MKKGFLALVMAMLIVMLAGTAMAATVSDYAGLLAALGDSSVATIELQDDIYVSAMLNITRPVVIDGKGHTITAASSFPKTSTNDDHLVQINRASNVTLKNMKLIAGANNKHTLNVFESKNVTLQNLTVDHKNAYSGTPLVINSSEVSIGDDLKLVTGSNSWFAMDVSKGTSPSAEYATEPELVFKENATMTYDNSVKPKYGDTLIAQEAIIVPNENVQFAGTPGGIMQLHAHKYINGTCICGNVLPGAYRAPRTGDESQLMLWAVLAMLSAAAMVVVSRKKQQA